MSGFTAVDANAYFASYPNFNGVKFTTPDGQSCNTNNMNSLGDATNRVLSCSGPRPDKGSGDWTVSVATKAAATIERSDPPLNPSYKPSPRR
jgi:hypothetical protein